MQDKRKEAQRIALAAASRVANASRITETLAGGIRRVQPLGGPQRDQGESQAALIMAAQSVATRIAGDMGVRSLSGVASRLQAMQNQMARAPAGVAGPAQADYYEADLIINDFPQAARYHVTHRDTLAQITERTGAAPLHIVLQRINVPYIEASFRPSCGFFQGWEDLVRIVSWLCSRPAWRSVRVLV
jgi:ATP-dependent RNA helicase DDX46/PRP5